jgi:hypothetical protein
MMMHDSLQAFDDKRQHVILCSSMQLIIRSFHFIIMGIT